MFWSAIRGETRANIIPLEGDPNAPRGGVTAIRYVDLLENYLFTILEADSIFMQDNARIHTARHTQQWFEEHGVALLDWPPYSPDLNPIENLWAVLKDKIIERYPELKAAPANEATIDLIIRAVEEIWEDEDGITTNAIRNVIESMPDRVEAVIAAEGWYTRF